MRRYSDLPVNRFVVVGSHALNVRVAKDLDIVCFQHDIEADYVQNNDYIVSFDWEGIRIECLLADQMEHLQNLYGDYSERASTASHLWLYILKAGHIHLPHRKWDVHIHDYHVLKSIIGEDAYKQSTKKMVRLAREGNEKITKIRTPRLVGVSKYDFFNDRVPKIYDHDNIHRCVAHKEEPMYTYMQLPGHEVECQRELWESFSFEDKVNTVLEECYVIALERFIIPGVQSVPTPNAAFKIALYKTCTTLTSGWFRQFAIDNYYKILNLYDPDFPARFEENIENYESRKH